MKRGVPSHPRCRARQLSARVSDTLTRTARGERVEGESQGCGLSRRHEGQRSLGCGHGESEERGGASPC